MDKTLSGATTLRQSGPGNNGNEGVLCVPQSSRNTGASPSVCFVSLTGDSLREVLPFSRYAVSVFCCSNRLDHIFIDFKSEKTYPNTFWKKMFFIMKAVELHFPRILFLNGKYQCSPERNYLVLQSISYNSQVYHLLIQSRESFSMYNLLIKIFYICHGTYKSDCLPNISAR